MKKHKIQKKLPLWVVIMFSPIQCYGGETKSVTTNKATEIEAVVDKRLEEQQRAFRAELAKRVKKDIGISILVPGSSDKSSAIDNRKNQPRPNNTQEVFP